MSNPRIVPKADIDGDDRRRFFRIDDQIALKYRVLTSEQLEADLNQAETGIPTRQSMVTAFATTSREMNRVLDKVAAELPDVGRYLSALNEKLDMLATLMALENTGLADQPTRQVNLSASGISFRSESALGLGDNVEMQMLILPGMLCMQTYGTVSRCRRLDEPEDSFVYDVAVDFSEMSETDQDLLIKHIMRRQSEQLRERAEQRRAKL